MLLKTFFTWRLDLSGIGGDCAKLLFYDRMELFLWNRDTIPSLIFITSSQRNYKYQKSRKTPQIVMLKATWDTSLRLFEIFLLWKMLTGRTPSLFYLHYL